MRFLTCWKLAVLAIAVASLAIVRPSTSFGQLAGSSTVGGWVFTTVTSGGTGNSPGNLNTVAPTIGLGTATAIGMTNNYTYAGGELGPSIVDCDFTTPGSTPEIGWRIRGNSNNPGPGANGWNNSAPQYSQGAQFSVPSAGFSSLNFSFDWFSTTQGVANLQPQYTIDGSDWINLNSSNGTWNAAYNTSTGTANGVLTAASNNWTEGISFSLAGTAALAAANDPNFGVRLVSAYDTYLSSGTNTVYGSAKNPVTTVYNNSSGNWSFNNIIITGNPILSPVTTGTAPAATVSWLSASGGIWDTTPAHAGNWSSPYADGNGALFPDLSFSGTNAVTIAAGGVFPGAVAISNSTGTYLFSGGPIGGGAGLAGTGSLGLTDSGLGVVILASSNTYVGGTAITNGGTLVVQGGDSRLGAASGELFLGNGSTVQIAGQGLVSSRSIIFGSGGGTFNTGGQISSLSGPSVINGPFTLTGGGNLTLTGNIVTTTTATASTPVVIVAGTTLTVGGTAGTEQNFLQSGGTINGNLVVNSGVRVDFSNATYGGSGVVQITYPGNVVGTGGDGTSSWAVLSNAGVNGIVTSGGTLTTNVQLNPNNLPHVSASVTNANFSLSGGTSTFIVGIGANKPNTNTFAITGNISGASDVVLGANDASGDGNGRLLLAGSNTYTGTTLVSGKGIVALGSSTALPATTDVVFNFPFTGAGNPVLDLNGNNATINSLESLPGTSPSFMITNSGSLPSTLTISGATSPAYPYAGLLNDGLSTLALVKKGTGTLGLSGTSTYSGGTTISGGIVQLSNATTTAAASALGIGPVTVQSGGALAGSTSGGGVTGLVNVMSGGQLLPGGINTAGLTLTLSGGLTLNAGSSSSYTYGEGADKGYVAVAGALTLPTIGSVTINLNNQTAISGIIPLFTFGSLTNAFSSSEFQLGTFTGLPQGVTAAGFSVQLDSVAREGGSPDQIDLYDPSLPIPAIVTWAASTGSGVWNTSTASTNWTGGSPNPNAYKDGDEATFADYAASSSTITIAAGGVQPGAVFVTANTSAFTFTGGPIAGATALNKNGSGLVTLAATNSYSGGTFITGGTLVVAAGDGSLGLSGGSVSLDSGATLATSGVALASSRSFAVGSGANGGSGSGGTFATNGLNSTLSGPVTVGNTSVAATFTKTGAGTLTLTGAASLVDTTSDTGAVLNAQGGNLQVTGPLSLGNYGSFSVAPSATLTLSNSSNPTINQYNGGTINGALVIANPMRVNFNAGTFSGTGQIQVQPASGAIITNAGSLPYTQYVGTIDPNIVLNSLNLPFTKTDVTRSTISTGGSTSFITTIGGTKGTTAPLTLIVNGVISGNSDVNFSNSTGGGGSGNVLLNAQNTYTGASLIDFTGNVTGGAQGGIVSLGISNALPVTTDVMFGAIGGAASGWLDLNGNNQQIGSLCSVSGGTAYTITNQGNSPSTLTISGTTTPAQPFAGTISDLESTVAIVKAGPNTLQLTGYNGYSGGTTVEGGMFLINGSLGGVQSPTGQGNVMVTGGTFGGIGNVGLGGGPGGITSTVGPGATLAPGILPYGATARSSGTLNVNGNLTLDSGASVSFNDFSGGGDLVQVQDGLTLPTSGSVIINLSHAYGGMTAGAVSLFTFYEGNLTNSFSAGEFSIGSAPSGATYAISENINQSEIDLTITPSSAASSTLSGGSASWGSVLLTSATTAVTLNNTSSAASTLTIDSDQSAGSLTFNASNGTITIAKGAAGNLTLGTSSAPPTIRVNSGDVDITASTHLGGNLVVTMSGGTTLEFGNIHEDTVGSSLTLDGNGQLILSGSGLYTGGTIVNGGTLIVESAVGLDDGSSLTVGAGASSIFARISPAAVGGSPVSPVPEPGTLALLAAGGLLISCRALRRRRVRQPGV
jgi:fibronectin-binding autotransporter adhesin